MSVTAEIYRQAADRLMWRRDAKLLSALQNCGALMHGQEMSVLRGRLFAYSYFEHGERVTVWAVDDKLLLKTWPPTVRHEGGHVHFDQRIGYFQ